MMDHTNLKIQAWSLLSGITFVILHTLISSMVEQNIDHSKECVNDCIVYEYDWMNVNICMCVNDYILNECMHMIWLSASMWKYLDIQFSEYVRMNLVVWMNDFLRFSMSIRCTSLNTPCSFSLYPRLMVFCLCIKSLFFVFNFLSLKSMSCLKKNKAHKPSIKSMFRKGAHASFYNYKWVNIFF